MAQHFIMSAAAKTLPLIDLCDLVSEDAAHKMLCGMRWLRHRWRTDLSPLQLRGRLYLSVSPAVQMQGSPPAVLGDQRNFAGVPKAAGSTLLMAFSLFVNAAKGISSLQLSRYLGLYAKTAFVLPHSCDAL